MRERRVEDKERGCVVRTAGLSTVSAFGFGGKASEANDYNPS